MRRCNILKINDEELVTISRIFGYPGIDLQDKCWILLAKYNLKMLILTCGTNGSYVFTPGVVSFQETPKVPVADTVGAGDSFTAAFTAAILSGKQVPMPINWRWKSLPMYVPERCHAGIAGGLERKAGIDFSYSFHIFRYLCSSAILNQRKVKMRQHNLRIYSFCSCFGEWRLPAPGARHVSVSAFPNVARMNGGAR